MVLRWQMVPLSRNDLVPTSLTAIYPRKRGCLADWRDRVESFVVGLLNELSVLYKAIAYSFDRNRLDFRPQTGRISGL